MQFCFVVTSNFSFTSFLFHCSSGKRAHVLFSCHMTMQLHRGTGKALFKKSQCIWGRSQQINWGPLFPKADLCQQGDPHTVWSSTALISTELLSLAGAKNLIPSACDSLLLGWCNCHFSAWGRFYLCLLLSSLYGLATLQCTLDPHVFLKVIHAHVVHCVCSWVLLLV